MALGERSELNGISEKKGCRFKRKVMSVESQNDGDYYF